MRVRKVCIRNGYRRGGPVRAEPAAETVAVVTSAEIIVASLSVAFFAFELVVCGAGAGVGPLAAIGIKIGVIADDAGSVCDDARGAERIFGKKDGVAVEAHVIEPGCSGVSISGIDL